jgi:FkbM family methyltransferase
MEVKNAVRRLVNAAGLDLRRLTPSSNPFFQLLKALNCFEVDLVLDVGANVGQFASGLRGVGYRGEIVSFEPLSAAHCALKRAASRDRLWRVHPRCAIGDTEREIEINIAGNSVSSSVLAMTPAHSCAAKNSAYIGSEQVYMHTLDATARPYLNNSRRPFLKIDVQGSEGQVLDGARQISKCLQGVQCELSLVALYEGQSLWVDVMDRLEKRGFKLWAIRDVFTDNRDGRTLQVDAIYFRQQGNSKQIFH